MIHMSRSAYEMTVCMPRPPLMLTSELQVPALCTCCRSCMLRVVFTKSKRGCAQITSEKFMVALDVVGLSAA